MKIGINFLRAAVWGAALLLSGCYYPPPAYPVSVASPASFDRSFAAAAGAMREQGLAIGTEDRAAGMIIGSAGSATVSASVRRQADGSVRVQFDATGARDPALIERISRSYDARMGR